MIKQYAFSKQFLGIKLKYWITRWITVNIYLNELFIIIIINCFTFVGIRATKNFSFSHFNKSKAINNKKYTLYPENIRKIIFKPKELAK